MKITLIFLLALFFRSALSQETDKPVEKSLGFQAGFQNRVLLDEQKSALVYSSGAFMAGFYYKRDGLNSIFSVSVDAATGNFSPRHFKDRWIYTTTHTIDGDVKTDSFPVTSGIISGKLQLSYLRKFGQGPVKWIVGPSVKEIIVYPENKIGLLNSLGFYATVGLTRKIRSRGSLQAEWSLPLFALNSRLPWHNTATSPVDSEFKTFFRKGTRLVGFNKFRMIEFDLNYKLAVSKHWTLGAGYNFTWMHVTYYQPMRSYINSFKVQTSFIF